MRSSSDSEATPSARFNPSHSASVTRCSLTHVPAPSSSRPLPVFPFPTLLLTLLSTHNSTVCLPACNPAPPSCPVSPSVRCVIASTTCASASVSFSSPAFSSPPLCPSISASVMQGRGGR